MCNDMSLALRNNAWVGRRCTIKNNSLAHQNNLLTFEHAARTKTVTLQNIMCAALIDKAGREIPDGNV